MKHITDIFFDLDHTLWDFEKNSALTFKKILSENKVDVEIERFLAVYVPVNLEYWRLYRHEKITKKELRYQRLSKTFQALEYNASDDLIDTLSFQYIEFLSTFNHLFDYTETLLDNLQERYKLHIITNGFREVQRKKMKASGSFNYFEHIIDSESVNVKKPNPKIFEHALELAKVAPENALMVGDSFEADIMGALEVNMHAIHVDFDKKYTHLLCPIVHHLAEIEKIL
ncbi:YjjG family noncanonical pyrimidine nucleotidase [Kordia sp.]|uniref:YjjG family noncanonical pyrimidine nucleotidase n=1 Tax=Kordia sp. TaxID=1965332 RepID=UPI0025BADAD5|nr:YjjG family noncanonical pyrimidine nucleotidase [Kordia sp.]MCH2194122.1 YjjG family noncanonical pyrimidine nucleotidase [Kordia sp.]